MGKSSRSSATVFLMGRREEDVEARIRLWTHESGNLPEVYPPLSVERERTGK
jgi:hypothetical protein